jgi:hypothetical protein
LSPPRTFVSTRSKLPPERADVIRNCLQTAQSIFFIKIFAANPITFHVTSATYLVLLFGFFEEIFKIFYFFVGPPLSCLAYNSFVRRQLLLHSRLICHMRLCMLIKISRNPVLIFVRKIKRECFRLKFLKQVPLSFSRLRSRYGVVEWSCPFNCLQTFKHRVKPPYLYLSTTNIWFGPDDKQRYNEYLVWA